MAIVELDTNKWGQVMSILADAPWKIANPLLMEIGEQLRAQSSTPAQSIAPAPEDSKRTRATTNSQEAHRG